MNPNFSKLLGQLGEIWKQLGLNQRVTIAVSTLAVLLGLGGLGVWTSRVNYGLLYGKLEESEASKVVAVLEENKVPYKLNGSSIMVPADQVGKMRMRMAAKGLPKSDGTGYELLDKPSFGITDFVQRANYVRAVQGELARTIAQLDEVESSRVMVVIPENRLLVDNQKKPTASVFVKIRGGGRLPQATVNAIRFLVANSVESLQPNHVSVVDNAGNVLSDNHDDDSLAGLSHTQLTARRELEQHLAGKAQQMLDVVLGPGQSVVRVDAELNWTSITKTEEKFDPEVKMLRMATINDETTTALTTESQGGNPGASSNISSITNNASGSPTSNNRTTKKVTNQQYEFNKTTSNILQSAGAVQKLTAAVFIAAKVEGEGAQRKVTTRSPEDLLKLKKTVQSALGIIDDAEALRKDVITLEEMPFNDQFATDVKKQLEQTERKTLFVEVGRNALYIGLGLAILAAFWKQAKRAPAFEIPVGIPVGQISSSGALLPGAGKGSMFGPGRGRDQEPAVVTVEVLNQLIRENPGNVTQAVRSWLTSSGPAPAGSGGSEQPAASRRG